MFRKHIGRLRVPSARWRSYLTEPLTEPLAVLKDAQWPRKNPNLPVQQYPTRISTLSNGMKVASQNAYGQFCTIGGEPRRGSVLIIRAFQHVQLQILNFVYFLQCL